MRRFLPSLALSLALAGCMGQVRPAGPAVEGGDALLEAARWRPPRKLALRQSAVIEAGGGVNALEGVLVLDPQAGTVRLVALSPMGVKLFDVRVGAVGAPSVAGKPLPGTERAIAAVSESLRRIYLLPPSGEVVAVRDAGSTRIASVEGGGRGERWVLDAASGRAMTRTVQGRGADWTVSYGPLAEIGGLWIPGEIALDDRAADFRLTVRTTEVIE